MKVNDAISTAVVVSDMRSKRGVFHEYAANATPAAILAAPEAAGRAVWPPWRHHRPTPCWPAKGLTPERPPSNQNAIRAPGPGRSKPPPEPARSGQRNRCTRPAMPRTRLCQDEGWASVGRAWCRHQRQGERQGRQKIENHARSWRTGASTRRPAHQHAPQQPSWRSTTAARSGATDAGRGKPRRTPPGRHHARTPEQRTTKNPHHLLGQGAAATTAAASGSGGGGCARERVASGGGGGCPGAAPGAARE